jgi:hypothetical protein
MAGPAPTHYRYDVFLSHSSADKPVVRELAERLRAAGLRVWFDDWIIKPGDLISSTIEDGLEHSAVLLFCMSAQAFGSDWALLESHTAVFRDPLNRDRRFVPLRLDDAPIKGMLRGYAYLDWRPEADQEGEWGRLLEACGGNKSAGKPLPPAPPPKVPDNAAHGSFIAVAAASRDPIPPSWQSQPASAATPPSALTEVQAPLQQIVSRYGRPAPPAQVPASAPQPSRDLQEAGLRGGTRASGCPAAVQGPCGCHRPAVRGARAG